jgi:hypothetical protein
MPTFEKSDYVDSIYYADLFRINKKIGMIMGYGKSEAARIATEKQEADDLSRDCVAIRNNNGILEGRFDPGGINPEVDSELFDFHTIDHIVYCLSPEQTDAIFTSNEKKIVDCDLNTMTQLSVVYPFPAYIALSWFADLNVDYLQDPERRASKFQEVLQTCNFKKLGLVPYMPTVEDKAKLYCEAL